MHGFLSYGKKGHPIINFATGKIATDDMKYGFIDLKERGEFSPDRFVGKFTQDSTKLNYYDPIKRQPLKLFEKKTIKKNSNGTRSKEFLDIQATIECRFTLKRVRDMIRTYSQ